MSILTETPPGSPAEGNKSSEAIVGVDPEILKKEKTCPDIWDADKKKNLFRELISEYGGLLGFYEKTLGKSIHIVFSVP